MSLKLHYKFEELSGTTAIDTSSSGYNGTLVNGVTRIANGIINRAITCAVDDYVQVGNVLSFDRLDPFSLSCWIKTTNTAYNGIITKINPSSPWTGWQLFLNTGKIWFSLMNRAAAPTNQAYIYSVGTVNNGQWRHIVATYNGNSNVSGMKLYVDGVIVSHTVYENSLTASSLSSGVLRVGGRSDNFMPFQGSLDEARIYNHELSQLEVTALYNEQYGPVFEYTAQSNTQDINFDTGTFHYLTIVLSNCTYNGNVFVENIEDIEALIATEFRNISNLEFRGVGCSMVRGDTDSLTLGVAAGYYSSKQDLTQSEALNLRAAVNSAITAIDGLAVSEVRVESTLIQESNVFKKDY